MERLRRTQQKIALVVLLVLCSSQAQAQDNKNEKLFQLQKLPKRLIPEYTPCTYKRVRYACFSSAAMIKLNTLEIQARYWHSQWEDHAVLAGEQDLALLKAQEQLGLQRDMSLQDQDQILVLNNRLSDEIEAKNEWRKKAENLPTWPLWVGGAAGVLGFGLFLGCLVR
jgi:hypothetical protein